MSEEGTTAPDLPPRPPAPQWAPPSAPAAAEPQAKPAPPSPSWPAPPSSSPPASRGAAAQPSWPAPSGAVPVPPQWGAPSWGATPPQTVPGPPGASPFAAPYAPAPQGAFVQAPLRRGTAVGVVALVVAVLAAVGTSIVAGIAAFQIGLGTDSADFSGSQTLDSLGFLSPVRDWVLLGEVAFWTGTGLGIWAIVQGIVATVTARGRVAGVIAVVLAVLGPAIFLLAAAVSLGLGLDAAPGLGGGL